MRLFPLAMLAALLPLVTIHTTYLLSAGAGQVEWCIPHIHSCTSISATGRLPPAYFVFKGLMIPTAVILVIYWLLSAVWLRQLGCRRRFSRGALVGLGLIAGAGLIFYSLVLGWIGDLYRAQRVTGVMTFFGFGFLAQLLITRLAGQALASHPGCAPVLRWQRIDALAILLLGLLSIALGYISPSLYDRTDDAFAWNFVLLLCLHVLITGELWRRTGFRLAFRADSN